jgi:signal transduction histidine kinase
LSLEVRDDGVGLSGEAESPARLSGSGIRNLRERAEMTAGQFSLSSVPEEGTSVRIVWPLGPDEAMEDTEE